MAKGGKQPGAGRPKGTFAQHTVEAQAAKQILIKAYIDNIKPINEALIAKATEGDIQAIKELHDSVYGKSLQTIAGPDGGPIEFRDLSDQTDEHLAKLAGLKG